ncbi:hypothetical protein TH47_00895 [Thalassospira sp. MCCC 1A02803]|nr:hypothetical protein TH47_00895 [Thalassospira sp. MCCC 1A02803]
MGHFPQRHRAKPFRILLPFGTNGFFAWGNDIDLCFKQCADHGLFPGFKPVWRDFQRDSFNTVFARFLKQQGTDDQCICRVTQGVGKIVL